MEVSQGFDTKTRQRVLSATDTFGTNPAFWQEFHATAVWKRFVHLCGATEANLSRVIDILNKMYGNQEYFSLAQVTDVFVTAINSGGSVNDRLDRIPVEVDEPIQEPKQVPVDVNGKKLTASQIAWSEMRIWSETASQTQRKERMRVDAVYRNFVQKNREREFEGVGDSMLPTNPHLLPADDLSNSSIAGIAAKAGLLVPQLHEWVGIYNSTPSSKVRSLRSAASNPLGYKQYEQAFQAAISARLI